MIIKKKTPKNYIDNQKFYEEMKVYKEKYIKAKEEGTTLPRISEYLGKCFMLLTENLANMRNFRDYPFLDEMKADALLVCCRYAYCFNHEKTQNPFAYFTRVVYTSFVTRIKQEKTDLYVKYKIVEKSEIFNELSLNGELDETLLTDIGYSEGARENMNEFVRNFEDGLQKKKDKEREKKNAQTE